MHSGFNLSRYFQLLAPSKSAFTWERASDFSDPSLVLYSKSFWAKSKVSCRCCSNSTVHVCTQGHRNFVVNPLEETPQEQILRPSRTLHTNPGKQVTTRPKALFLSGLDHSDRRVDCAAAARVPHASYHLAVVTSDVLLDSDSQSRAHRSGTAVSVPLPSGGHRTTTLRTRIRLTCWKKDNLVLHVCSRGRACLSLIPSLFLRCTIFTVWSEWRCCAGSAALRARSGVSVLFRGGRGASCRSLPPWSPRIPPSQSLRVPGALRVFSRVSLMAPWKIVSASAAFCSFCS